MGLDGFRAPGHVPRGCARDSAGGHGESHTRAPALPQSGHSYFCSYLTHKAHRVPPRSQGGGAWGAGRMTQGAAGVLPLSPWSFHPEHLGLSHQGLVRHPSPICIRSVRSTRSIAWFFLPWRQVLRKPQRTLCHLPYIPSLGHFISPDSLILHFRGLLGKALTLRYELIYYTVLP